MDFVFFADESGTSVGEPCYAIGALLVPADDVDSFNREFDRLIAAHGVTGEVRWSKVSTSHGLMNFGIDLLRHILGGVTSFNSIVVLKSDYFKWREGDKEEAFYTTYSLLLEFCARAAPGNYSAYIDDRQDAYNKRDEALEVITNRMLDKISARAKLASVKKVDSRLYRGIQAADFLTGAIKAAHHLYLDTSCPLSPGKRLLLERLAGTLGWKHLHYDTWPNHDFNIWHFPWQSYRAVPGTLVVRANFEVPYVMPDELARVCHGT
jgi:hypothetical protein